MTCTSTSSSQLTAWIQSPSSKPAKRRDPRVQVQFSIDKRTRVSHNKTCTDIIQKQELTLCFSLSFSCPKFNTKLEIYSSSSGRSPLPECTQRNATQSPENVTLVSVALYIHSKGAGTIQVPKFRGRLLGLDLRSSTCIIPIENLRLVPNPDPDIREPKSRRHILISTSWWSAFFFLFF
jgi:hypothetical protein